MAGGDFGLASGDKGDGQYGRLWYAEPVGAEEVAFESGVFLLTKAKAEQLRATQEDPTQTQTGSNGAPGPDSGTGTGEEDPPIDPPPPPVIPIGQKTTLRLRGTVPPEVWNRLGTRILPKLRSGDGLSVGIELSVSVDAGLSQGLQLELRQALTDLGLQEQVSVEESEH